jgi:Galactose mutarotase and related enzymes
MTKVEKFILKSKSGFSVEVLNLGGIITKIMAQDKHGNRKNVVLSYDDFDDYKTNPLFLGCFVGPVAGRTKDGILLIDQDVQKLDISGHPNSLHSCKDGLHNVLWRIESHTMDQLVLTYNVQSIYCRLTYKITYTVSDEKLDINYYATSDHKTYLSLTNHSYFNLSGDYDSTILSHTLQLNCTHLARLDDESLPVELLDLAKSSADFITEKRLYDVITSDTPDIKKASGIDHPFKCGDENNIAVLKEPISGRMMKVSTTQPYVIIYSGNFLHSAQSSSGRKFTQYSGICFETQDLPNILNNKLDTIMYVTPESPYKHSTSFDFSIL